MLLNTINDPGPSIVHTVAQTLEHVRVLDLLVLVVEGRPSTRAKLA